MVTSDSSCDTSSCSRDAAFSCVWLPVLSGARMAAPSAGPALPSHLNKHHLSWPAVYNICQGAATLRSSDPDPRPQRATDGTRRWQGVWIVDVMRRASPSRSDALPHASAMSSGCLAKSKGWLWGRDKYKCWRYLSPRSVVWEEVYCCLVRTFSFRRISLSLISGV